MLKIVGISEICISKEPGDVLVSYSLGSCIGLAAYDHQAKVGGMVHCMLPFSKIDPKKAALKPCMFTDSGVSLLLEELFKLGASKESLILKAAGAASLRDEQGLFKIGERNYVALRKTLWKSGMLIEAEDVQGVASRTLPLYMKDGKATIKSGGREVVL